MTGAGTGWSMEMFDETDSESGRGAQDRISGLCGWLDSFKTFLLFIGEADVTKESASFYCKRFLNMGHSAIISPKGRKVQSVKAVTQIRSFFPLCLLNYAN